jgi:uncharacterized membrane protein YbhN (UPF0104 family)
MLVVLTLSPAARWLGGQPLMSRRVFKPFAKVLHALDGFRMRKGAILFAGLRGCLFWSCAVASQWCYMRSVGADRVTLAYAAVVVTVANMVTMLPIALGGYGLREGTFSALLVAAHMATVAQGVAVGACLIAQTVIFGLMGLPSYLSLRSRAQGAGRMHHAGRHGRPCAESHRELSDNRQAEIDLIGSSTSQGLARTGANRVEVG